MRINFLHALQKPATLAFPQIVSALLDQSSSEMSTAFTFFPLTWQSDTIPLIFQYVSQV